MTRRGYSYRTPTGIAFVDYDDGAGRARYANVTATADGNLALSSSFDRDLVDQLKLRIPGSDRKWDKDGKVWLVSRKHGQTLVDLCHKHLGVDVVLPAVSTAKPKVETRLIRLDYVGQCWDRGGGESSANGWCNGSWSIVFPENVLREWFEGPVVDTTPRRPDAPKTLYQQLGIQQSAGEQEIRTAHRRLARQWHPDVAHEEGAAEVFKAIQAAYEVLSNVARRAKYDAGLRLQAAVEAQSGTEVARWQRYEAMAESTYRPLLRCGWLLVEGSESLGRFVVARIVQWEDEMGADGKVRVTSWVAGGDSYEETWR